MQRFLVVYGTTDGHTAKVAAAVADRLRGSGAEVDVFNTGSTDPSPGPYDGVILAASIHAHRYQRSVERWVRRWAAVLAGHRTLFLSVCLATLQQDPAVQHDLAQIVERFAARTAWRPGRVQQVAGALPYTRYGWLKRMMMVRISRSTGGATDTSRDHEYTDWAALGAAVDEFRAACAPAEPVHAGT
ncbi:MAG TPA: flavodoxin domain-containing protein [Gemmatimonadales bacterium]|nr:flavodoxin domain-containing protein [Gemmatimonadales bacterium]